MKIFDSSTIIAIFREAKCPKVFINSKNRGYKLILPSTVYNELKRNEKTYNVFLKYSEIFDIVNVNEKCLHDLADRYPYFHFGEIGVICASIKEKNLGNKPICILDEKKARKFCEKRAIRTSGLIGFLKWQKSIGDLDLTECRTIYGNLCVTNFYIKENILQELLK